MKSSWPFTFLIELRYNLRKRCYNAENEQQRNCENSVRVC